MTLYQNKGNDTPPLPPVILRFTFNGERGPVRAERLDAATAASGARGPVTSQHRILLAMPFDQWCSVPEIAARAKLAESTVRRHLSKTLLAGQQVQQQGEGHATRYRQPRPDGGDHRF
jgi:hypothetical protein